LSKIAHAPETETVTVFAPEAIRRASITKTSWSVRRRRRWCRCFRSIHSIRCCPPNPWVRSHRLLRHTPNCGRWNGTHPD